jgi:hypothetical protein
MSPVITITGGIADAARQVNISEWSVVSCLLRFGGGSFSLTMPTTNFGQSNVNSVDKDFI